MEFEDSDIKVVLLDIEGTVCPISFVQDVLFPYALRALPPLLEKESQWPPPSASSSSLAPFILAFPRDVTLSAPTFLAHVTQLSLANSKAPALKALQGYLWTRGYDLGELVCPLFPDVVPAMRRWTGREAGDEPATPATGANQAGAQGQPASPVRIHIYSSGSVAAQRLLFAHTTAGDVTPRIAAYHDPTTVGPKTAPASYAALAAASATPPPQHLFLSDSVLEVRAAVAAGMRACVVLREGNAPLSEADVQGLVLLRDFDAVLRRGRAAAAAAASSSS